MGRKLRSAWSAVAGVWGRRGIALMAVSVASGACGDDPAGSPEPTHEAGGPAACERTAECAGGEVCRYGYCERACRSDLDCVASAPFCGEEELFCIECREDLDCPVREACFGGFCLEVCLEDVDCAAGEFCDAATGVCADRGCVEDADCGEEGIVCGRTGCQLDGPMTCTPNATTCEADVRTRCDAWGRVVEEENCATTAACTEALHGCACSLGACRTRVCEPGTTRCGEVGVERCSPIGMSWSTLGVCGAGQVCVDDERCAPVVCEADERWCSGNTLNRCDVQGTSVAEQDCGALDEVCVGTPTSAECVPSVCEPLETRCSVDATAVLQCDEIGIEWLVQPCDEGWACAEGGVCEELPPVPVPTGLTAGTGGSEEHVEVRWREVEGASGYWLLRNGESLTEEPITATRYVDSSAPAGGLPETLGWASASVHRTSDVWLAWYAVRALAGEPQSYRVQAVVEGRIGALSPSVTGFRAGPRIVGYDVRVQGGDWERVSEGSTDTDWFDTSVPLGRLVPGELFATTDHPDHVELRISEGSAEPAPQRGYRVRAVNALGPGGGSPTTFGERAIGNKIFAWEWSANGATDWSGVPGANGSFAVDSSIPPASSRWYRARVSAEGAAAAVSSVVRGARP